MKKLSSSPGKNENLLLIFLLAGLVSLPFLPALFSGGEKVLSHRSTDIAQQFFAYKHFLHEELRNGRLPLWNPYIMSGTNFHGEGQPALFYPATWLFSFLSPGIAINLYFLSHSLLLTLAFFFYLRELGLTKESSFFGSLVLAISSVPVLRIYPGHLPNYPALALAPLFLLFWEKFLKNGRARNLLLLSVIYACLVLAGHAQFLFYFSIFFLFYSLWTIFSEKEAAGRKKGKRTLALIVSLLLGIILSSAHLLPAWDFAQNSFRQRMTYDFCSQFSFAPENFLTLLYPSLFGDRVHSAYWGRNNLWEMTAYLGVIPLLFAALGALFSRHPRRKLLLTAVVLFSLLALGSHTPLFYILYKIVPLFDKFRGNSKFITLMIFSLSILAALGFELLFSKHEPRAKNAPSPLRKILKAGMVLSLALALISGIFFWTLSDDKNWNFLLQWRYAQGETLEKSILKDERELRAAQKTARESVGLTALLALGAALYFGFFLRKKLKDPLAGEWLLLAGILIDLFLFGAKYYATFTVQEIQPPGEIVDVVSREKDLFRVMAPSLPPNTFMPSKIESIEGFAGNVLDRYNRFINRARGMAEEKFESYIQMTRYFPAFKLLNVQYMILPSKIKVEPHHFQRLFSSRDLTVYQSLEFIPRIYSPKRILFVDSSREALALAAKGDFEPRDITILEDRARAGQKIEYGESPIHLQLLKYTPNEIHLQTQSSQARLIVIANSFDPNWKASIDGQKVIPIIPANYVLQGVHIPEGAHLLKIYFFPDSLKTGIILSAIGLLAWGLLWVWGNRRIRPI